MASSHPVDSPAPYDAEDVWQCWQVAMRDEMWHKALLEMLEKKPRVHTVHGLMRMLRQDSSTTRSAVEGRAAESLLKLGFAFGPDSPITA